MALGFRPSLLICRVRYRHPRQLTLFDEANKSILLSVNVKYQTTKIGLRVAELAPESHKAPRVLESNEVVLQCCSFLVEFPLPPRIAAFDKLQDEVLDVADHSADARKSVTPGDA